MIDISNNNHQNNSDVRQLDLEKDERYVGQLVNGLRHGKGALYYKNNGKIKYEGDFVYGKYDGYGELYNKDGTIKYKGLFKNNKYEGNGKLYDFYSDYWFFCEWLKTWKGDRI